MHWIRGVWMLGNLFVYIETTIVSPTAYNFRYRDPTKKLGLGSLRYSLNPKLRSPRVARYLNKKLCRVWGLRVHLPFIRYLGLNPKPNKPLLTLP